ncbi:metal-dependent hydrolase [bacterium]|jgi:inner membrane protein|nr:metal-dependent hydrolase [bacterium]
MDSLSQLVLGAAVGYAVAGKKMGKKALLWGAFAGSLPDLDFIPTLPFQDEFIYLKHHRGFSHSFVGALVMAPLLAKACCKLKKSLRFWPLFNIFLWGIVTHFLLDCFTTWGTQIFWPLSTRVSWNTIFIVDPLYTIPLLASVLMACMYKSHRTRQWSVIFGLIISSFYLIWVVGVKQYLNPHFEALFRHHRLDVIRYTTRPTAFNSILWSTTAETDAGYYYGQISLMDSTFQGPLYFTKKNHTLPKKFADERSQELISYTKGYYSIISKEDSVYIHDFRYAYLGDPWLNKAKPVFAYLIKEEGGVLTLSVDNPRPENSSELLKQAWVRMKGI